MNGAGIPLVGVGGDAGAAVGAPMGAIGTSADGVGAVADEAACADGVSYGRRPEVVDGVVDRQKLDAADESGFCRRSSLAFSFCRRNSIVFSLSQ